MRVWWLTWCLACGGCRFSVTGVQGVAGGGDDGGAAGEASADDGSADDHDLAQLDLVAPPDLLAPFCGDPALAACFTFEDGTAATTALDGTAHHNDLTLTGASEVAGGHSGAALTVGPGGLAHVAHNASFDVSRLTIELWIFPTALPGAGARAGLVDSDGQYGLFIYPPGVLTCATVGTVSSASNLITTGAWQHVACTYDLTTVRVFRDGVQVASQPNTSAIVPGNPNGLCVGSNSPSGDVFSGLIDDVRIFGVARTPAQICADFGGPGC